MALRLARAFAGDPAGVLRALPGHIRMQARRSAAQDADPNWDEQLHGLLGAPWPCPEAARLTALMAEVVARLAARGLAFGRHTYGGYSDPDASFGRAAWCAVRHVRPAVVVETGVARGVTSQIVLEALDRNDRGRLWSIDLPYPFDHALHVEIGAAVTAASLPRWTYVEGPSRRRLPGLIRDMRQVDVFIHDSLHTARNTRFEMDRVAAVMRPGGIMLVDDVSTHDGFASFARDHAAFQTIVCPSADRLGQFGTRGENQRHRRDAAVIAAAPSHGGVDGYRLASAGRVIPPGDGRATSPAAGADRCAENPALAYWISGRYESSWRCTLCYQSPPERP